MTTKHPCDPKGLTESRGFDSDSKFLRINSTLWHGPKIKANTGIVSSTVKQRSSYIEVHRESLPEKELQFNKMR